MMLYSTADVVLASLMLAFSIVYMLEMPWRRWRNRPVKRWMPLWGEFLLPLSYLLLAHGSHAPLAVRVLTVAFMLIALAERLILRKRLGVPAWPQA